ncbi:MAG: efflux RND transporter periplasmic adaptor subunit [Proteobacteria bacterium]|nr:efflux RND transporter periplasmic adaptor subunit [Pseudomonadota bacterium]
MALDKAALESLRLERDPDAGKYRQRGGSRRKLWAVLAAVAVVAAVLAWRSFNSAVPVQTVTVESPTSASGAVLNASGYVVARRLATVSSKVTGQVAEVLFEEGAAVEAGQVLARLDRSTVEAQLNVSSSNAEAARRNLREIEVRLADARRTLERNRSLVERKLVSQSVLDSSEAEVAALGARLAAARAEVDVAIAQVGLGKQELADLEIRAPFKGVVISKDAQPGEMVSPMSAGGGFTRTGVATIVDMDSREVEVDVNESYINRVSAGQKVECVLDAYPDLEDSCARHQHRADGRPAEGDRARAHRPRSARSAHPAGHGHQGQLPRGRFATRDAERAARARECDRHGRRGELCLGRARRQGREARGQDRCNLGRTGAGHGRPLGWRIDRRRRAEAPAGRRGRGAEGSDMNAVPAEAAAGTSIVRIRDLVKDYRRGAETVRVLDGLSLDIRQGDFVALMGPSGSGKSTLLNLIGGLDRPTSGTLEVDGLRVDELSEGSLGRWRADHVGFIFQMYNLLPVLTAERNVELPLLLTNLDREQRMRRVAAALKLVGLEHRAKHRPRELSGGQEQRVGIARAIVTDPTLLLCDEPTGDLDRKSGDEILTLLEALNDEYGKTIIMVTHDPHAAERSHRVIHLDKGMLSEGAG